MNTDLELYDAPSVPALPERLSLPEILETAKILAASGYFPTAKEAGQAAAKIMWGQDMGLTPMQAMTGIHVWVQAGQTTMQVSANAIAFLLKRHGFTWKFVEHTEDACEVEVYRHGKRLEPNVRYTKRQAAEAQLANKPNWKGYGEDMVWNRVAGRIARRFAPEIFDAASIPAVTTEEAESTYPDPRDDLVKALHATYRERFPKPADMDPMEYRARRLMWSSEVLNGGTEDIPSWNGPEAPETLTRADVQTLLDVLESTPALIRGQAAPISPGVPSAAGADSTAPQGSAGEIAAGGPETGAPRAPEGTTPSPAEHHTAEVLGEVAPAVWMVLPGESRSDTGLPPGPGPATRSQYVDPVAAIADDAVLLAGAPAKSAPTRKRHKTDPGKGLSIPDAIAEKQRFMDERKAQTVVEHPPADPIQSMPPTFRELFLKHFGNELEPALGAVNAHIIEWGPRYPATGDAAPWSLELLQELAADTFEKDMYR